jgi:PKHD-type hydroxylase
MLVQIPQLLSGDQVRAMRAALDAPDAPWVDGRMTAGHQGARVKQNQQIDETSALARTLGDAVLAALERHPLFISACCRSAYPPLFNRYEGGCILAATSMAPYACCPAAVKIRTDVSATLFLAPPDSYDGGELLIEDTFGTRGQACRRRPGRVPGKQSASRCAGHAART